MMNNMKKVIRGFTLVFFLSLGLSTTILAQDEGDIAVGLHGNYGTDIEKLGVGANGTYTLNETMRVGADFTYWLIGDDEVGGFGGNNISISYTYFEINGNFNYIFYNENNLMAYGIGSLGIHYAKIEASFEGPGIDDASESELGLGIGAGVEYNLDSVALFAEPRIFLSGFDQLSFMFGARIGI
jgi:outer membrane protein X